jgi:hypothetical protein
MPLFELCCNLISCDGTYNNKNVLAYYTCTYNMQNKNKHTINMQHKQQAPITTNTLNMQVQHNYKRYTTKASASIWHLVLLVHLVIDLVSL